MTNTIQFIYLVYLCVWLKKKKTNSTLFPTSCVCIWRIKQCTLICAKATICDLCGCQQQDERVNTPHMSDSYRPLALIIAAQSKLSCYDYSATTYLREIERLGVHTHIYTYTRTTIPKKASWLQMIITWN